jgi:hypothetical protein
MPGPLHLGKESYVQLLHLIYGIRGEAHKLDIVFPTGINDPGRKVTGQAVPINTFFPGSQWPTDRLVLKNQSSQMGISKQPEGELLCLIPVGPPGTYSPGLS